ncbi:uncharacterized protein EV420DRAFT_1770254 [Desarmillaria tabescens]|uniref:Uncharacterized protein n=1 Tax=Armillaria tabescens TaxID=1929756 RepID=A0AA39MKE3_ARMTA|nr:uncharacterized protein EV420DRAFT_1770254 [Desarmillaria tabescens]KAK0436670.1 hypothetical protein EV420DRAFT_1770254 [Desarmillaria tabescens]
MILHREITGSKTANSHVGTTPNVAGPGKLPLGTYHDPPPRRLAPWRRGELAARLEACQVRPGMCFLVPMRWQECEIDVGVDWEFWILTSSFTARKELSTDVVDPPPCPPGSPFPREFRTTPMALHPTSKSATTFLLNSQYHACGIHCSRTTGRQGEDRF